MSALGSLIPQVRFVVTTPEGVPIPEAYIKVYAAGTSTPVTVYTTAALSIALPWPVVADGDGLFPAMFVEPEAVKVEVYDADDTLIYSTDNIVPPNLMAGRLYTHQLFDHGITDTTLPHAAQQLQLVVGGALDMDAGSGRLVGLTLNPTVDATSNSVLQEIWGLAIQLSAFLGAFSSGAFNVEAINCQSPILSSLGAIPTRAAGLVVTGYPNVGTERYAAIIIGPTRLNGAVQFSNTITPTQLTVNTNNWSPTDIGGAYGVRVSASGAIDLTGIDTFTSGGSTPLPAGNAPGRALRLINVGSNTITLKHESASSTAGNRFACPGAVDFSLTAGLMAELWYDSVSARWRVK